MAHKPHQVLLLDPVHELTFKGPFTEYVTSNLKLTNPTSRCVHFKVKTTAPKFYCVRPNSGIIKPAETAVINVMLQPVDQGASNLENERARHKFMIQTAFAPDHEVSLDNFWKTIKDNEVMDSKLRVVFLSSTGEPIDAPAKDNIRPADTTPAVTVAPTTANTGGSTVSGGSSVNVSTTVPTSSASSNSGVRDYEHLLQKEIELRKMYQDEKNNLERENNVLLDKLNKLAQSAGNFNVEGLPLLHVILVAILALLVGIIFGKILF